MCCFSRDVKLVADTNIFARASKDNRQYLVYSMRIDAGEELAMILPIPVPKNSPDDAVTFINLEKYPNFFDEMRLGFPEPRAAGSLGGAKDAPKVKEDKPLKVVEVGSFEASFVPAIKDFRRLDERFRLPTEVWDKLPQYKDYGFAVFKLKKGAQKVHPMAFEFPRADAKSLFFPTVHIHDGKVHPKAGFDHTLYCQTSSGETLPMTDWKESFGLAQQFMKIDLAKGLVDGESHCHMRTIRGTQKNEDVLV